MRVVFAVAALAVAQASLLEAPVRLEAEWFEQWMADGGHPVTGGETLPQMRTKMLKRLQDVASLALGQSSEVHEVLGGFGQTVESALSRLVGSGVEDVEDAVREALTALTEKTGRLPSRLQAVRDAKENHTASGADPSSFRPFGLEKYPYFGFLPAFVGALVPDKGEVSWKGSCFKSSSAHAETNADGTSMTLRFSVSDAESLLCADHYFLATLDGVWLDSFFLSGTHELSWKLPAAGSEALRFDVMQKGVRVFSFRDGWIQTVIDILDTVSLFIPAETSVGISKPVADRNRYFMEHYAGQPMAPRPTPDVDVDESLIHSGDFFGIIRLDGLDPMLGWAMGSTTGHTTVALWFDDGLYICESTVTDSYWPTDGVQRTPYREWVRLARAAGYQTVWAPLTAEARAAFNATAAIEFFKEVEGLEYGYRNLLYGWLDTVDGNYPCLPPDWSTCITWELIEIIYNAFERLIPAFGDMIFTQAFNLRLGTWGLKAPELLLEAHKRGIDPATIPSIVEDDTWRYNTTRHGKQVWGRSMVCCVFVCHTWKAAGLFDNLNGTVNCGELTNWDDYALDILDPSPARPQQCVDADPHNPNCQISGDYTLLLNNLSSKSPYAHMAEKCPSKTPDYYHPPGC